MRMRMSLEGNADLQFGTFPPLEVRGDQPTPVPILAVSPSTVPASGRMIPPGKNIPLGSFQVIKSKPQPAPNPSLSWTKVPDGIPIVNVEVLRFRFTPARGHLYKPPKTVTPLPSGDGSSIALLDRSSRAFLRADSGWTGVDLSNSAPDAPPDTYDDADVNQTRNPSCEVVDDTCEVRIGVSIPLLGPGKQVLVASTNLFVGPPDFAPDRRPFISVAHELNDQSGDDRTVIAVGGGVTREASVKTAVVDPQGGREVFKAEIDNPTADSWTITAPARVARLYHSIALLLPEGRVISTDGNPDKGSSVDWPPPDPLDEIRIEIFSPPYLLKQAGRPTIADAPLEITYGANVTIKTAQPTQITTVNLIRPGVTTHFLNSTQRLVNVPFVVTPPRSVEGQHSRFSNGRFTRLVHAVHQRPRQCPVGCALGSALLSQALSCRHSQKT
jgi:hypothetical protein